MSNDNKKALLDIIDNLKMNEGEIRAVLNDIPTDRLQRALNVFEEFGTEYNLDEIRRQIKKQGD
jgi:hypothetical protein